MALKFKNKTICKRVIKECYKKGLLTFYFLNEKKCMRISPPLIITKNQIIKASKKIIDTIEYCQKN